MHYNFGIIIKFFLILILLSNKLLAPQINTSKAKNNNLLFLGQNKKKYQLRKPIFKQNLFLKTTLFISFQNFNIKKSPEAGPNTAANLEGFLGINIHN